MSDAVREAFRLCTRNGQRCVAGSPLACSFDAGRARLIALRESLVLRIEALFNQTGSNESVALERAAVATSEIIESGIAADGQLTRDQLAAMLNYQLITRRALPTGWADGPFSLRQIAGHLVYDQIAGMEKVLHSEALKADARVHQLAAAASTAPVGAATADVRGAGVSEADGMLRHDTNGTSALYVAGFNSVGNLIVRGRHDRAWRLDENGAQRLRAIGTNVVVLFASPSVMLREDYNLSATAVTKLVQSIESVEAHGLAVIVHVPSTMPSWAVQRYPGLGRSDGQHSISYDIDHPHVPALMGAFFRALHPLLAVSESNHASGGANDGGRPLMRACRPSVLGYQLANEPALRGTASEYTLGRFSGWLTARYSHNVTALDARWHHPNATASVISFEAAARLAAPAPHRRALSVPSDGSGAAARLADWLQFNQDRATEWQATLARLLWEAGDGSHCHRTMAKINTANTIDERLPAHGVDAPAVRAARGLHMAATPHTLARSHQLRTCLLSQLSLTDKMRLALSHARVSVDPRAQYQRVRLRLWLPGA